MIRYSRAAIKSQRNRNKDLINQLERQQQKEIRNEKKNK